MNGYRKYLCRYNFDGASWNFEIDAESPADAKERIARLAFANCLGEVVAEVPASFGAPTWLVVVARNVARKILAR